jgi:hypothetical protein
VLGEQAAGRAMGDDPRHGVAAGVVVGEDLGEEAPECGDRVEDPIAVADAVLVEGLADAGSGQDVGEGEAVVAREAGAELIQADHGMAWVPRDGMVERGRSGRRAAPLILRRRKD